MPLLSDSSLPVGTAAVYALLGYAIVFFGLILLMILVILIGKIFIAAENRKAVPAQPPVKEIIEKSIPSAPGTAGQLKLHNVDPKTAAMLMAITAEKMGRPINELRFLSIKEVQS